MWATLRSLLVWWFHAGRAGVLGEQKDKVQGFPLRMGDYGSRGRSVERMARRVDEQTDGWISHEDVHGTRPCYLCRAEAA